MGLNEKIGKLLENAKLMLFFIVIFGLILRLIFFSGMGISDDLAYSKAAYSILEGRGIDPNSTLTLSTRLGLIYPIIFSYKLFGINNFSSVLFVLMASIGNIVLIFYFGKLLFNEKTGLMAAFLLSFFPLDVVYATKLNSDIPSAFFMALGVYAFLYSEIKKIRYGIGYFLAGISIGIGYLIRETALLIALFFIVYLVFYKGKIRKAHLLVPLGVLAVIITESLIFLNLTGNQLFRFHASQQYLADAVAKYNYFGRLDFPTGLFHYPWLFLTNSLLVYFYIPIFIALIYAIIKKKRDAYITIMWIIPLLSYISFGSTSLAHYIPFIAKDRYTSIITTPAILLLSFLLSEKKPMVKRLAPILVILLLSISIVTVYLREDRNLLANLRQAYPELESLNKTVYTDSRSIQALNYISGFKNLLGLKEFPENFDAIEDSYVMVNRHMIRNLKEANKNIKFPDEIKSIPKEWEVIKELGSSEKDKIVIYQIP